LLKSTLWWLKFPKCITVLPPLNTWQKGWSEKQGIGMMQVPHHVGGIACVKELYNC